MICFYSNPFLTSCRQLNAVEKQYNDVHAYKFSSLYSTTQSLTWGKYNMLDEKSERNSSNDVHSCKSQIYACFTTNTKACKSGETRLKFKIQRKFTVRRYLFNKEKHKASSLAFKIKIKTKKQVYCTLQYAPTESNDVYRWIKTRNRKLLSGWETSGNGSQVYARYPLSKAEFLILFLSHTVAFE